MRTWMIAQMVTGIAATTAQGVFVDFENTPALPTGPSLYSAAGPMQVIDIQGKLTFSGGVVLGNPTAFPAIVHCTAPNVYGTTNGYGLDRLLTIDIDPGFYVNQIEGVLANGSGRTNYRIEAYSGGDLVDSQDFIQMPSGGEAGFGLVNLTGDPITRVVFTPLGLTSWNYLVDSFNVVPEPGTLALLALGGLALIRRRRQ